MTPEMFRKLSALGLSHEQMAGVLEIFEADAESRKAKGRDRWHKWKANKSANVSQHVQTLAANSREGARVEDNLQTKKITGQKEKEESTPQAAKTPRGELETVLDSEHASAVIEHRQKLRKPLTARAAFLLAGKLRKTSDPNAAADAIIANGWQGFEPEWLENRQQRQATGPPRRGGVVDQYAELEGRRRKNGQDGRTIDHRDDECFRTDKSEFGTLVGQLGSAMQRGFRSGDH